MRSKALLAVLGGWLASVAGAQPPMAGMPPKPPQPPAGTRVIRDVAYVKGGGPRQKLDLYLPRRGGKRPLIILIHGGGFMFGSKEGENAAEWLKEGYAVASLNYRLSGDAPFPAAVEDCKAAVRWLRGHAVQYGLDAIRFGAFGRSAGANLAAMLGTTGDVKTFDVGGNLGVSSRVQAVADWFGPTDFLQMDAHRLPDGDVHNAADSPESRYIGGPIQDNKAKTERANPIRYITRRTPPFFIAHGDRDRQVPHHQSELLAAALKKAGVPVTLHTVKGAGHAFEDAEATALTKAFFARYLRGGR